MHLIRLHNIHHAQTSHPLHNNPHNPLQITPTQTLHNILHKKQHNSILNHLIFLPRIEEHIQQRTQITNIAIENNVVEWALDVMFEFLVCLLGGLGCDVEFEEFG